MTGQVFSYDVQSIDAPRMGLIALQSDETIECDLRRLLRPEVELMVSRVPSDPEVSSETLAAMEAHLSAAAGLFPVGARFDAIGYGCTSGTAQIGVNTVAAKVQAVANACVVTQPLTSLVAACEALGIGKLAVLSPYVASVSQRLQAVLAEQGIATPALGSFNVATEATVARIAPASIEAAALTLMGTAEVDALFISCTNLRTLDVIASLEARLDVPVLSSNQVLAWHMMRSAGIATAAQQPYGRLFDC